jgi:hypothetical protein
MKALASVPSAPRGVPKDEFASGNWYDVSVPGARPQRRAHEDGPRRRNGPALGGFLQTLPLER